MKKKNYKTAIVYLNGTEVYCGPKQLERYVNSFNTSHISWFISKTEMFEYIKKELSRKKKVHITKGYKRPYVYEVWFNN
jgi:hypothetical protein